VHHSHRPRRAAARRSKANAARRAGVKTAVLHLLPQPLHLSSTRRVAVESSSATPHAEHRKSVQAGGLSLVSLHNPLRRVRRSTGTLGSCQEGGPKTTLPTVPVSRLGVPGARGGEGRAAPLLRSKQL
jgi:hypothetical protein